MFEKILAPLIIVGLFSLGLYLAPKNSVNIDNKMYGYFLDVGQGDSILLNKNSSQILIDGGPDKKVVGEMGNVLPPFDKKIEFVIITHPHADHIAGLIYVFDRYDIGKVYLTGQDYDSPEYAMLINKIQQKSIPAEKALAGTVIEMDDIKVKILWPTQVKANIDDINGLSLVGLVEYGDSRWLLMGDLPEKFQNQMIEISPLQKTDLVKVAHHGSKNGVSEKMLSMSQPDFAVISVGDRNDFGHPAKNTLSKLGGINTLRTDQLGTIKFMSDGKNTSLFR